MATADSKPPEDHKAVKQLNLDAPIEKSGPDGPLFSFGCRLSGLVACTAEGSGDGFIAGVVPVVGVGA
jgi:hypothetical protein